MAYLYRGVHAKHPRRADAGKGNVYPGNALGTVTPIQHNAGGWSAFSPYTSWTYNRDVAVIHACDEQGSGIILRVSDQNPNASDTWHWVDSVDEYEEEEKLLFGVRVGVEVDDEVQCRGDGEVATD